MKQIHIVLNPADESRAVRKAESKETMGSFMSQLPQTEVVRVLEGAVI